MFIGQPVLIKSLFSPWNNQTGFIVKREWSIRNFTERVQVYRVSFQDYLGHSVECCFSQDELVPVICSISG